MNNSLNNGLLPIVVSDEFLKNLQALILKDPSLKVKIELEKQTLTILPDGDSAKFSINPYKKECLLKGLDDIDFLLTMKSQIISYENNKNLVK
jgi:3-isopropylmalate/(R)-2-methylmalate dehydratase small subunit